MGRIKNYCIIQYFGYISSYTQLSSVVYQDFHGLEAIAAIAIISTKIGMHIQLLSKQPPVN